MITAAPRDVSVLRDFEDFYSEIIRLRARAELQFPISTEPNDTGAAADPAIAVWSRLVDLLERQARLTTTSAGDIGYGLYREAQYVMAALADEIFLNTEWSGRDYWTNHLLESHFFNSNIAGEEFFRRTDRLLRDPERGFSDIYSIHLLALSLGFRGKYRGREDVGRIDEMRRRLFIRIYHRKAQAPGEGRHLFVNCYAHTLDLGAPKKLPSPARWFLGLAAAVVLWVVISTVVWHGLADGLEASLAKIRNHAASDTAPTSAVNLPKP